MNPRLISVTTRNSAVLYGDARLIPFGESTWQESLVEFAGRLCYDSVDRMGRAPGFVMDRVREGHEDIIEHVWVTVRFDELACLMPFMDVEDCRLVNRHSECTSDTISANLRVWLDFFRKGYAVNAIPILKYIAPSVFAEFKDEPMQAIAHPFAFEIEPTEVGPQRVTMLGANCIYGHHGVMPQHAPAMSSATFLFEGVSRALTHQLVRHRMSSISQVSQRYVDLAKGEWQAIVPPAIAANTTANAIMSGAWDDLQKAYTALRKLGIRKEDARFLLPNACETRLIVTMNYEAWSHFLWLRAVDKAAQWEIRTLGLQVLEQLYQLSPTYFQQHKDAL